MERRTITWRGIWILGVALLIGGGGWAGTARGQEAKEKESSCVRCHLGLGGGYAAAVRLLEESVHAEQEVGCPDCHGGDPKSFDEDMAHSEQMDFMGKPSFGEIPGFCARCHSDPVRMKPYNLRTDQLDLYRTSQHGQLFYEKKDRNTATCLSCHGAHDIKASDNPMSRVFKANIPKMCSECHSDKSRMAQYKIPTDQYDQYVRSRHGIMLLEKHDPRAPACPDCHGVHSANPPGHEIVATVCQMCHATIARLFKESPHYFEQTDEEAARCIDCHGDHDVAHPTTALYEGEEEGHCAGCHDLDSKQVRLAKLIKGRIDTGTNELERAASALKKVASSGKSLTEVEEAYETARSELVKARAATHTLDIEQINEHVNPAIEEAEKVQKASARILREISGRRKGSILVLAILGVIIAVVFVKIHSLKTKE